MNRTMSSWIRVLLSLMTGALVLSDAAVFAQEPVAVPALTAAPTVDGIMEPEYRQGAQLVDFWDFAKSVVEARPASKDTRVWLGHFNRTLYVFCEASEPQTNLLKTTVTLHDGSAWTDDSFELFLDIEGQRKNYFQFILSSNGTTADFFKGQKSWNAEYDVAAKIWSSSWSAEWAIPFKAFGIASVDDINAEKRWTFNICRNDIVGDELLTWVPVNSAAVRNFGTPALFAEMHLVLEGGAKTYSLRGTPLRPFEMVREQLTWKTTDPLFGELLSKKHRLTPGHSGFFWTHPVGASQLRPMAVQYGVEYSLEETGDLFKSLGMHPIQVGQTIQKWVENADVPDRYPTAGAMYATNFKYARAEGMPTVESSGLTILFAPRNRERYLQQAEEVLRTYSDEIWGVFTGDEITHYQTYGLIKAVSEQSSLHPYAQAIDRDVRDRFGLGQYGVPRSVEDQEPYRWMAVEKWIDDQVCLLTKDLRKVVDRVAPQMLLVSDDPEAGFHGHDYARRGKWCDIVTHQTYPSRSPMRQEVGFITKMLFDLSGKSVWPCVHAENYGASYSPEETAEVYSQVFRCGGDGIHYYPDDVQGTRRNILDTHYCRIGAPDRWATMQAIFERVRDLPRLKLPRKTRTAIFIEPSTYQATLPTKRGQHLEYEMCFSFLGPNARSWFQFVHAGQVARNEVKLSQHRTVFLPMAKFFDPEMAQSLIEFCKKGGTVICGDPEVFRYSTQQAYQPVPALNELGWKCSDKTSPVDCIRILRNDLWRNIPNGTTISFPNPLQAFVIEPRDSFETLAHFDTGTPAIVCRKLGKGNWVQFAFQPFTYECLCNETMRTLFRSILERQGEKTGLDIWRFTFPVAESPKPPKGQCLTGNACVWEMNVPRNVGGSGIPITVRWTTPPQGVNEKTVSSDACRLFDRRKALTAQNDRQISSALENWTYIWETQNSFNVELELNATHTLDRLQVWFSGALPKADVLIHTKGDVWSRLGAFDAMDVGEDVAMITVSLENAEADCVRIVFAPSSDSNRFSLCELEVWAPSK